tara:strand:- start:49249 stop:50160 length:912 start_codon:yes stop_codon:yes gene_type:complete
MQHKAGMNKQLQIFLTVARLLNLSKAAESLKISTSQVSRNLSQLEKQFKHTLVQRSPQKVSLTESGKTFYVYASQIEETWLAAQEEFHEESSDITGLIKLSCPQTFGMKHVLPKIQAFAKSNPQIDFNVDMSSSLRNVVLDDYDIIIRSATQLPDSDLKMRKMLSYKMVTCAAPSYLKNHKTPQIPDDLAQHDNISNMAYTEANNKSVWQFYDKNNALQKLKLTSRFCVSNYEAQLQLALDGLGIAQLPNQLIEQEIKKGTLVSILNAYRTPEYALWLLHPYPYSVPKRIRLLIEYLCDNPSQ